MMIIITSILLLSKTEKKKNQIKYTTIFLTRILSISIVVFFTGFGENPLLGRSRPHIIIIYMRGTKYKQKGNKQIRSSTYSPFSNDQPFRI